MEGKKGKPVFFFFSFAQLSSSSSSFVLIVWNIAASYILLAIYYIAQGQTFIAQKYVCRRKRECPSQALALLFIYFFLSAARACHRLTTVTFKSFFKPMIVIRQVATAHVRTSEKEIKWDPAGRVRLSHQQTRNIIFK